MGSLKDLEVAFEVADQAADLALGYFEAGVTSTPKADGSSVTEADLAVERLLRESLGDLRPEDAVLGEEKDRWAIPSASGFLIRSTALDSLAVATPTGGSTSPSRFVGVTEPAVVTSPALGLRWWATRGGGAFESAWPRTEGEARRLTLSMTSSVADATIDAPDTQHELSFRLDFAQSSPLPLVKSSEARAMDSSLNATSNGDFGVSLVASAATSAVRLSVMRNTMPALVWVVITDGRLLLIERPATGSRVGEIVFQAPPSAVRAIDQSGLRGALELVDAEHGDTLAFFNFGLRKGAAREVLAALG